MGVYFFFAQYYSNEKTGTYEKRKAKKYFYTINNKRKKEFKQV